MAVEDKTERRYDGKFSEGDIAEFVECEIGSDVANSFDRRFDADQIFDIMTGHAPALIADKYDKQVEGDSIVDMYKSMVPPANLDANQVYFWMTERIRPLVANKYDQQFDGDCILDMYKSNIFPDEANACLKFTEPSKVIKHVLRKRRKLAKGLPDRFPFEEAYMLVEAGISPEVIRSYSDRFDSEEIKQFVNHNISADTANGYNQRFNSYEALALSVLGVGPLTANSYCHKFFVWNIYDLFHKGIMPEDANEKLKGYNPNIHINERTEFILRNIPPKEVNSGLNKYSDRFSLKSKCWLLIEGVDRDTASRYDLRFYGGDIAELVKAGIKPEDAVLYGHEITGEEIISLIEHGLTPEKAKRMNMTNSKFMVYLLDRVFPYNPDYKIVGVGSRGVLAYDKQMGVLSKIAPDLENEFALLSHIKSKGVHFKNVVNLGEMTYSDGKRSRHRTAARVNSDNGPYTLPVEFEELPINIIELQYIRGRTLEEMMANQEPTSIEKVISFSSDILHGLIELRSVGIWYHRDVRPANIMIDEEKDNAIITDLGIATTDRDALPLDNKRFGGPNDLTSLGQVMYYMTTGQHIFDQSQSMSKTFGSVADTINDYRTQVYADETGQMLEKHLQQVDQTIQDARIATIIKSCLTAGKDEHERIQKMFQELK